ncbi:hypothetical protein CLIB1423_11S04632 [[Candida] railenensis]|uniref:MARVEL domain-containing protein n=1 Tax=[Candida] railenensis TaxID=45579 RepID=A0A9P0VZK9_9ASCO|nr:hypothetical protein CLIB1423_11S04632 [[Candida] railenensis]
MTTFHPYGQDVRVVSDLSRFEYATPTPRNRSRNPTPTSIEEHDHMSNTDTMESFVRKDTLHRQPTMIEIAERHNKEDEKNAIYDFYMDRSSERLTADEPQQSYRHPQAPPQNQYPPPSHTTPYTNPRTPLHQMTQQPDDSRPSFAPYPESVQAAPSQQAPPIPGNPSYQHIPPNSRPSTVPPQGPPPVPLPKDLKYDYRASHATANTGVTTLHENDLPPLQQPGQFYPPIPPMDAAGQADAQSIYSRKKDLEIKLMKSVMGRPIFAVPTKKFVGFNKYEQGEFTISLNFILYLFEIVFSIAVLSLCGVILNQKLVKYSGIYKFFIADGSVTLFVSILFATNIINYEKRNGGFYCLLAFIFSLISFIMDVSTIIQDDSCSSASFCRIRKAISAFIIITTFVWFSNLVMFMTTYYISRLNLLGDINFDFSDRGLNHQYVQEFPEPEPAVSQYQLEQELEKQRQEFLQREESMRRSIQREESMRRSAQLQPDGSYMMRRSTPYGNESVWGPSTTHSAAHIPQPPPQPQPQPVQPPIIPQQPPRSQTPYTELDVSKPIIDPHTGIAVKEFLLNERGELFEIDNRNQVRGRKMMVVYTS